jgi:hypothetical protein
LKHMATENLMLASTILSSRSPFLKPLRSLGFIFPSRRFPYILRVNSDELDSSTVKHVRDWHITFGDADFV